jgi:peptidoglycan/xylan/chitin deacetylase (PgdA/CDA1 family)
MIICLRFDIDTKFGLVDKTLPLLDLLDRWGMKATFFCVMGPEPHLLDIIRFRLLDRSPKQSIVLAERGGLAKLIKSVLLPGGVGFKHPSYFREIVARGHEVQPHGWKHILWQRNFQNLDIREVISRIKEEYIKIMGVPPQGFSSPGRVYSATSMRVLDEAGFLYQADMDGEAPFRPPGYCHWQVPVTFYRTFRRLRGEGLTDTQISTLICQHLSEARDYACLYEHPESLFEPDYRILETVFEHIRASDMTCLRLNDLVKKLNSSD